MSEQGATRRPANIVVIAVAVYCQLIDIDAACNSARFWENRAITDAMVAAQEGRNVSAGLSFRQPWIARVEPAGLAKTIYVLPEKPSTAVLPFDRISGDDSEDFFADSLIETTISALSEISTLLVIACKSSFLYRSDSVDMKKVRHSLCVAEQTNCQWQRRVAVSSTFSLNA